MIALVFLKESTNMRMILVGAGQVGGIIGGRLARAGHDVVLCDADAKHVQAIRTAGLRVDLPGDSFTVKPQILFPWEVTGRFEPEHSSSFPPFDVAQGRRRRESRPTPASLPLDTGFRRYGGLCPPPGFPPARE